MKALARVDFVWRTESHVNGLSAWRVAKIEWALSRLACFLGLLLSAKSSVGSTISVPKRRSLSASEPREIVVAGSTVASVKLVVVEILALVDSAATHIWHRAIKTASRLNHVTFEARRAWIVIYTVLDN